MTVEELMARLAELVEAEPGVAQWGVCTEDPEYGDYLEVSLIERKTIDRIGQTMRPKVVIR